MRLYALPILLLFFLHLALLIYPCRSTECGDTMCRKISHAKVTSTSKHISAHRRDRLSKLDVKVYVKRLIQLNFDEYGDFEAPPGLAEANHGPIVFSHPRRRRRRHPRKHFPHFNP
ncbi:hypothetical protein KP509_01G025100 [Ceratopteris richardii]|uniref:Uncharacterized protein n=1 Tax=Ceratopteris richardii TaxID=49495 RepID=A0A8T2VBG9_CERRI|nr:hypothetical protein KP509_01G025100 [Ceratopteris richardii]